ncbi:MAG: phage recombination protein Bet [Pseudomonadota bacterium]
MVVQPPRMPMPEEAFEAGITPARWKALVDAIFPSAKSVNGVLLAIDYCKARNLDIFKRVVHIVPMYNAALGREVETVWPGISELRTTASRTGSWAGNDDALFGPTLSRGFDDSRESTYQNQKKVTREECPKFDFPEWCQITVYRIVQGHRVAFVGPKVRFIESFSGKKGLRVPNEKWQSSPFWMLEKCAEAAALRRAFPEEMGGELTAEEMEGKVIHDGGGLVEHRPTLDGGEATRAEPKTPTRHDLTPDHGDREHEWGDQIQEEIRWLQGSINKTTDLVALVAAREQNIVASENEGWPQPAIDELARLFDEKIALLKKETPEEGDNAGAASGDKQPASEEDNDQKTD